MIFCFYMPSCSSDTRPAGRANAYEHLSQPTKLSVEFNRPSAPDPRTSDQATASDVLRKRRLCFGTRCTVGVKGKAGHGYGRRRLRSDRIRCRIDCLASGTLPPVPSNFFSHPSNTQRTTTRCIFTLAVSWADTTSPRRATLEQRTGRRSDQPPQDPQAVDVT